MTDSRPHKNDETLPEELTTALKQRFQSPHSIPPEIDQAILRRAHEHFAQKTAAQPRKTVSFEKWIIRTAAAAAVLAIAWLLVLENQTKNTETPPAAVSGKIETNAPHDIDRSGRVDILDAFTMAKAITHQAVSDKKWDFNHDGTVDKRDVDIVALAAVKIPAGG